MRVHCAEDILPEIPSGDSGIEVLGWDSAFHFWNVVHYWRTRGFEQTISHWAYLPKDPING